MSLLPDEVMLVRPRAPKQASHQQLCPRRAIWSGLSIMYDCVVLAPSSESNECSTRLRETGGVRFGGRRAMVRQRGSGCGAHKWGREQIRSTGAALTVG